MTTLCTYAGVEYSEGAEVCHGERIKKCVDGTWVDTGRDCGPGVTDAVEAELRGAAEDRQKAMAQHEQVPFLVYHYVFQFGTLVTRGNTVEFVGSPTEADYCTGRNVRPYSVYSRNVISIDRNYQFCPSGSFMFGRISYRGYDESQAR